MTTNTSLLMDGNTSLRQQMAFFDICFGLVDGGVCFVGLIAYAAVILVIIRYKRTTFSNAFYTLCLSLAVPDCYILVSEFFTNLPRLMLGAKYRQIMPSLLLQALEHMHSVAWWVLSSHMVVISINRLVAVCLSQYCRSIFRPMLVLLLIIASYVYGFLVAGEMAFCGCRAASSGYGWALICDFNGTCAAGYLTLDAVFGTGSVALIVVIYILIFTSVHIRSAIFAGATASSTSGTMVSHKQAKERSLMVQFGLIGGFLVAYQSWFWLSAPMIAAGVISPRLGEASVTVSCVLNSAVNPIMYLCFSSDIREQMQRACCGRKLTGPASMVPRGSAMERTMVADGKRNCVTPMPCSQVNLDILPPVSDA